jgi:hypothetical protein
MTLRAILQRIEEAVDAVERPWTASASAYQAQLGVHEPWVAEISPVQYAHMGKAAKARYDRQRAGEWEASGRAKEQWRQAVLAAFRDGRFDLGDAGVHPDAKAAVFAWQREQAAAQAKVAQAARQRENAITDAKQLKVGDRVWLVIQRAYAEVIKVSAKSVQVRTKFGPYKVPVDPRAPLLNWQDPRD